MRNQEKGFTLIELLIVIAIIGILAAVLVPNLLAARSRAYDTAAASCAKQISVGQEVVYIETYTYVNDLVALNSATQGMASNCEPSWVDDSQAFTVGWEVTHPSGTSKTFVVGPGGIIPPP